MIHFFSDLDNTLIYSRKHDIGSEKQCVELYQGRETSFCTQRTLDLLAKLTEQCSFIPVTTRTQEQYRRIQLPGLTPDRALVCNGGVLLHNGMRDKDWYCQSLELAAPAQQEMREGVKLLAGDPSRTFEVRWVDGLFVFTKSDAPEQSLARLRQRLSGKTCSFFQNGAKIYILPHALNKGAAVTRYLARYPAERTLAAGDSDFDVPMLLSVGQGFAPEQLYPAFAGRQGHCVSFLPAPFSEWWLAAALSCM